PGVTRTRGRLARALGLVSVGVACVTLVMPGAAVSKPSPKLVSISVAPGSATLPQGGYTEELAVTGHYSDGSSGDVSSAVSWNSTNARVATVNAAGTVTSGATAGTATITATTSKGKKYTGSAVLTIAAVTLANIHIVVHETLDDPLYLLVGESSKL